MKVKIKQNIMLQAVEIQKRVNDEIKIEFLNDGIHFKSVDPGHTEMLLSFISKKVCDEYRLENTGELEIGIEVVKLSGFLKLGKKDNIFVFDYDPDSHRLIVKLGYLKRTMGLIDIEHIEDSKVPKLELKNQVLVNTKVFYDTLKNVLYEPIKNEKGKEKLKQIYSSAYLTIQPDRVILENLCSFEEDKDRKNRDCIIADTDILTVISGKGDTTAFSDEIFKHLQIFKKNWGYIIVETDYFHPIKITGDNGFVQFEYWQAPIITDDIDRKRFEETQKQYVIKEEIKTELKLITQWVEPVVKTETVEPLIALQRKPGKKEKKQVKTETISDDKIIDIYSDRLSICKPKGLPYDKYQWTSDMERIRDRLEKSLEKQSKKALSKAASDNGFVFFIVHSTDKTRVDNITGEGIIEKLLPDSFVLIAWYRYNLEKWIVQTVEKVS